jgi:hypothetical protein
MLSCGGTGDRYSRKCWLRGRPRHLTREPSRRMLTSADTEIAVGVPTTRCPDGLLWGGGAVHQMASGTCARSSSCGRIHPINEQKQYIRFFRSSSGRTSRRRFSSAGASDARSQVGGTEDGTISKIVHRRHRVSRHPVSPVERRGEVAWSENGRADSHATPLAPPAARRPSRCSSRLAGEGGGKE